MGIFAIFGQLSQALNPFGTIEGVMKFDGFSRLFNGTRDKHFVIRVVL